jgi:hypothetical protein
MKLDNLRPCDLCRQPVAGRTRDGQRLDFYRFEVEHHVLDLSTVREHLGLSLMLGSESLARAFASQERGSVAVSRRELLVCGPCVVEVWPQLSTQIGRELPTPEADALLAAVVPPEVRS